MLVTTSVVASLIVTRNRNRKSIFFQNTSSVDSVYIKRERNQTPTISASDFDFLLGPNSGIAINSLIDGTEAIQDSYTVKAVANTPVISVFETEDIIR